MVKNTQKINVNKLKKHKSISQQKSPDYEESLRFILIHTYYNTTEYLEPTSYLYFGHVMRMNDNRYPKITLLEEVHRIR